MMIYGASCDAMISEISEQFLLSSVLSTTYSFPCAKQN